jgi:hypothetical protein
MKTSENFPHKLLVEGKDDQHVIWALCQKNQIPETFEIIDCNGKENLIDQIPIRFKSYGVETIGIIIDADNDLNQTWTKIRSILSSIGFEQPEELPDNGLVVQNNSQKAGVWIMPNNKVNGMLEDFISFLVPHDDQLFPIVESTLENIESKGLNNYQPIHHSKASIHTWLAWQENPGTPMGAGITKRYLTTDEETCSKLFQP